MYGADKVTTVNLPIVATVREKRVYFYLHIIIWQQKGDSHKSSWGRYILCIRGETDIAIGVNEV